MDIEYVSPPLRAFWGLSAKITAWALAAGVIIGTMKRCSAVSAPSVSIIKVAGGLVLAAAAGTIVLALSIYLICRIWRAQLNEIGLRASTYYGWKRRIPWHEITAAQLDHVQGLPVMIVYGKSAPKGIYVYILGQRFDVLYAQFVRFAGANNPVSTLLSDLAAG